MNKFGKIQNNITKYKYYSTIAFNKLYVKKCPIYISKHKTNHEKEIILLVISNGGGWHYVAVKKLSVVLRDLTSKSDGDLYCLNCLHSFRTTYKLQSHENYVIIKSLAVLQ